MNPTAPAPPAAVVREADEFDGIPTAFDTTTFARSRGWHVQHDATTTISQWHVFRPGGTYHGTMETESRAWDVADRVARKEEAARIQNAGDTAPCPTH